MTRGASVRSGRARLLAVLPARADEDALGAALETAPPVATDVPLPRLWEYPRDIAAAVADWFRAFLTDFDPSFAPVLARIVKLGLISLIVVLALLVLAQLVRALVGWRRGRVPAVASVARAAAPPAEDAARTPAEWWSVLERRLEDGDVAGALGASWWWLATRLVGRAIDPSWTSRELLAKAGRPDLLPRVRVLDRMLYGAGEPEDAEVRGLVRDLAEEL